VKPCEPSEGSPVSQSGGALHRKELPLSSLFCVSSHVVLPVSSVASI
jgi:hypothetical protein